MTSESNTPKRLDLRLMRGPLYYGLSFFIFGGLFEITWARREWKERGW